MKVNNMELEVSDLSMLVLEKLGFSKNRVGTYFLATMVEDIYCDLENEDSRVDIYESTRILDNEYTKRGVLRYKCSDSFYKIRITDAFENLDTDKIDVNLFYAILRDPTPINASQCAFLVADYLSDVLRKEDEYKIIKKM